MTEKIADFASVLAVGELLDGLTVPWWIAGGWAIDLAAGRVTRRHGDVDVMLFERDEHALQSDLPGVQLRIVTGPDEREEPWPPARRLLAGSDRIRVRFPELPHPTEILLGAAVRDRWVHHRGNHAIARPLAVFGGERYGLPFLPPEVVLAVTSLGELDKHAHDFRTALPLLDGEQRRWLADAVTRRWHALHRRADDTKAIPGEHPWVRELTGL